jgi:predicted deacetylase
MRPRLLASLHDVSPLTLDACRDAVELLRDGGIPPSALTVMVVPYHDEQIALDQHPGTIAFLHELADHGATLVAHGYTHMMASPPRSPLRWLAARWFARSQGEFAACDADETRRRLALATGIFDRAGLTSRIVGFVPPAWLLSRGARETVDATALLFHERFAGIVFGDRLVARRLIGWGSLTAIEAVATASWAWLQARRAPADTRLAVHPPDLLRAVTRRSIARTLRSLVGPLEPVSYDRYLRGPAA